VEADLPPQEVTESLTAIRPALAHSDLTNVRESLVGVRREKGIGGDPPLERHHLLGGDTTQIDEEFGLHSTVHPTASGEASIDPSRLTDEVEIEAEALGHEGGTAIVQIYYTTENISGLYYNDNSPRERSSICRTSAG
jgi:hypothetical protein